MRATDAACSRGRELVSLRLDGELSELEGVQLEAHLARCADCRAFEADIVPATAVLRAAPVEVPDRLIALPRRRRVSMRPLQAAAAAAVVALGVGLSTTLVPRQHREAFSVPFPNARAQGTEELRILRQVRRAELLPRPVVKKGHLGRAPV